MLGRFGGGGGQGGKWRGHEVKRVRDEDLQSKGYGFREFWKDLFGGRKEGARGGGNRTESGYEM